MILTANLHLFQFKRLAKLGVALVVVAPLVGCASNGQKQNIGTAAGAVVGGVIGNRLFKNSAVGTTVGAAIGALIGNRIGSYLDEQDQISASNAMQSSLITGGSSDWKNSENGTSGSAKVVKTTSKPKPVRIPVLKSKVSKVPPLDIIGGTYEAKNAINVRGGPGTDFVKVGKLGAAEAVNVVGKVKNAEWYLISQNGVGNGFVYAPLLVAAPLTPTTPSTEVVDDADVVDTQVATATECRTVEQTINLADGSQKVEKLTACQGANGWEVQT